MRQHSVLPRLAAPPSTPPPHAAAVVSALATEADVEEPINRWWWKSSRKRCRTVRQLYRSSFPHPTGGMWKRHGVFADVGAFYDPLAAMCGSDLEYSSVATPKSKARCCTCCHQR